MPIHAFFLCGSLAVIGRAICEFWRVLSGVVFDQRGLRTDELEMPDELLQFVYTSRVTGEPSETLLHDIRDIAVARNEILGVTGVLLYGSGRFLQLLEGPPDAVLGLVGQIEKDPRHTGFLVLARRLAHKRVAPAWSMGVLNLDTLSEWDGAFVGLLSSIAAEMNSANYDEVVDGLVRRMAETFQRYAESTGLVA